MKPVLRRTLCALLAVLLTLGLIPGAAASSFSDISDINTAQNVEVLQMMGVIDGMEGGSYNPAATLTRAQFCKMAVEAMGQGDRVLIYKNYTIYPDVKPSYWAAGYINLAARTSTAGSSEGGDTRLITGYSDGLFRPNQTITYGQAVTILMRMLGYSDADVGVIWPEGYIDAAMVGSLARGLQPSGSSPITRAQAAQLFVNLLTTKQKSGGKFYETLGTAVEAILLDSNAKDSAGNPMMDTSEGSYYLAGSPGSGMLSGRKGLVLLNSNQEAITFIPSSEGTSKEITISKAEAGAITDAKGVRYTVDTAAKVYQNGESQNYVDAFPFLRTGTMATIYLNSRNRVETVFVASTTSDDAVIVGKDGSTEGFALLTDRTDYKIVKHGETVTAKALREFDVATYSSSNNTIYISDNRMTVYYQEAYPSPSAPTRIKATGIQGSGEDGYLEVMPCAIPSLSQCRVGQSITLLLTENNKVAGVSTSNTARGNAVGFVDSAGKLELFNGLTVDTSAVKDLDKYAGQLVTVSSHSKTTLSVSKIGGSGAGGDFDVAARKVGNTSLAADVRFYETVKGSELREISLSDLEGVIKGDKIAYAHKNYAGKIDILVLEDVTGDAYLYGRATVQVNYAEDPETGEWVQTSVTTWIKRGDNGAEKVLVEFTVNRGLSTGDWVGFSSRAGNDQYITSMFPLTEVKNVPSSAWRDRNTVYYNGTLYTAGGGLDNCCYNVSNGSWFRNLSAALAYGGSVTLMVDDNNVIRGIEVRQ